MYLCIKGWFWYDGNHYLNIYWRGSDFWKMIFADTVISRWKIRSYALFTKIIVIRFNWKVKRDSDSLTSVHNKMALSRSNKPHVVVKKSKMIMIWISVWLWIYFDEILVRIFAFR